MKPDCWRGIALAISLALGLWACRAAPASPDASSPTTLPPTTPRELTQATSLKGTLTRQASSTPGMPPTTPTHLAAVPTPSVTPPAMVDGSLVAQYDPWSLGHAVAWSPDGKVLVISAGEAVNIYAGDTLRAQGQIDLQTWGVGLAFSPADYALLAVAGRDGALQLWNVDAPVRLAYQVAHARGAASVAISPDGMILASSGSDPMVRLWHTAVLLAGQDVQPMAVMIGGAVAVPAIRLSPDGKLIASIDLAKVRLRDPSTQRLVRTLDSGVSMFTLAFSPDGQWLAAGELGNQVRVWHVASGDEAMRLSANPGGVDPDRAFVWSLGYNANGSLLAAGSSTGTLTIWSMPGGAVVKAVQAHDKAVSGLAFYPLGQRLVTCGLDAAVRLWFVP